MPKTEVFGRSGGVKVNIGRYCSFGPNVRYFGANHPIHYGTMTPYFYRKEWGFEVEDVDRKTLNIGNDVWLGYNSIILSSCEYIGNGAIVAAGSVVTHNVEPYSIVAGAPAKVVKDRFTKEVIDKLEESKWWEMTPEQLFLFYCYIKEPLKWATEILKYKSKDI